MILVNIKYMSLKREEMNNHKIENSSSEILTMFKSSNFLNLKILEKVVSSLM